MLEFVGNPITHCPHRIDITWYGIYIYEYIYIGHCWGLLSTQEVRNEITTPSSNFFRRCISWHSIWQGSRMKSKEERQSGPFYALTPRIETLIVKLYSPFNLLCFHLKRHHLQRRNKIGGYHTEIQGATKSHFDS